VGWLEEHLAEVNRRIETLTPQQALRLHGRAGVCFVDLRDGYELLKYGRITGAEHCPRGSLEFRLPVDSRFHRSYFSTHERYVFYCSHGQRSILATHTAQQLGLENVCHIEGGMIAWVAAGGPVDEDAKELDI